ncbi:MAG TPA: Rieske 2Fe-2S domain-containing protein [Chloroflexota bacterium]|nr:Rieske 2Fe-2S domain-containing protein [Chloroflexota bacterium]
MAISSGRSRKPTANGHPSATEPASRYTPADYQAFQHTGPGTLAGRYLRRFWQPVYSGWQLKPGHAVPLRVMSEDFTLYRAEDGCPHVVAFRCAHRGTQLSTGWVEGDCIRCFYHGWKYDATGQCVEMPAEDPSFPPKVKIPSYPTAEYLGTIFAYFGEGEPPPMWRFPVMEQPGIIQAFIRRRECNYFQNVENSVDEVHIPFVHRSQAWDPAIHAQSIPEIEAEETEYGLAQYGIRPGQDVRVSPFIMPNVLHIKGGWDPDEPDDWLFWRVPIDDESHMNCAIRRVPVTGEAAQQFQAQMAQRRARMEGQESPEQIAQRVLRGELRVQDLTDRPDIVIIQDEVAQVGQGRIQDHSQERLGRSDRAVILLRKLWARELEKLATGQPLTQWHVPDDLGATLGLDRMALKNVSNWHRPERDAK